MHLQRFFMNYQETLDYLYNALPMFQQIGSTAYKEGLENTLEFDNRLGYPHSRFKTIHVAGTNGKGSTSHLLAATLQSAGYKVGLYTSPHLLDFRERIRINGQVIGEEEVIAFTERHRSFFEERKLSFFEMTTALAFYCFAQAGVDIAVIETGLGGRLDCTNIITPILSIITNIGFDHTQQLGNTLEKIASEKAGIIKKSVPVIIGRKGGVETVFRKRVEETDSPLLFSEDEAPVTTAANTFSQWCFQWRGNIDLQTPLGGYAQQENANTVLTAIEVLRKTGIKISDDAVKKGFKEVVALTGLRGRWEKLHETPTIICDTAHNADGISYIVKQLSNHPCNQLRIVFGMVEDKELRPVLELLPHNAIYYFTQASVKRALKADTLQQQAAKAGLKGCAFDSVASAIKQALKDSYPNDLIFVGGSTFVVADALSFYERERTAS